jgi:hypothetical protein
MFERVRLRILFVAVAGWVNRQQLEVIAYLRKRTASSKSIWASVACTLPILSGVDSRRRLIASDDER